MELTEKVIIILEEARGFVAFLVTTYIVHGSG